MGMAKSPKPPEPKRTTPSRSFPGGGEKPALWVDPVWLALTVLACIVVMVNI